MEYGICIRRNEHSSHLSRERKVWTHVGNLDDSPFVWALEVNQTANWHVTAKRRLLNDRDRRIGLVQRLDFQQLLQLNMGHTLSRRREDLGVVTLRRKERNRGNKRGLDGRGLGTKAIVSRIHVLHGVHVRVQNTSSLWGLERRRSETKEVRLILVLLQSVSRRARSERVERTVSSTVRVGVVESHG